uniref:Protein LNK3-like n=1 Tax=Caenorhabditis tropicalis TaxID=1561998 RepID=A0A1I7UQ92_9PELO
MASPPPSLPDGERLPKMTPSGDFSAVSVETMEKLKKSVESIEINKAPKRKDTPAVGKKDCDVFNDDRLDEVLTFGRSLAEGTQRFGNFTDLPTLTDLISSTNDEPCSSAQAEARLSRHLSQYDGGYYSTSPAATYFRSEWSPPPMNPIGQFNGNGGKKEKLNIVKIMTVEPIIREAKTSGKETTGSVETIKKGEKKTFQVNQSSKLDDVMKTTTTSKKPRKIRPENMPVEAPNHFAGNLYGYLLETMTVAGTQSVLDEYESKVF